jgi:hypothetical protein
MKAYFEKVPTGTGSLVAFERADPCFPFDWLYHPEFELTLILESAGQRLIGDNFAEYGPGDLVLLGPNLPHTWRSTLAAGHRLHRAIVIQFRDDFLGDKCFALPEMTPVAKLLKRCACGLGFSASPSASRVARRLADVPSLTPGRRVSTLLDILLDLAEQTGLNNFQPAACVRLAGRAISSASLPSPVRSIRISRTKSITRVWRKWCTWTRLRSAGSLSARPAGP